MYQGWTVTKTSHLPIRYFLALLWAHPILHVIGIRVNVHFYTVLQFSHISSKCSIPLPVLFHFKLLYDFPLVPWGLPVPDTLYSHISSHRKELLKSYNLRGSSSINILRNHSKIPSLLLSGTLFSTLFLHGLKFLRLQYCSTLCSIASCIGTKDSEKYSVSAFSVEELTSYTPEIKAAGSWKRYYLYFKVH